MAIQVAGVTVVDDSKNISAGIITATAIEVNPLAITFSPTDGSSDVALNSNIVITYNASISKGTGNITLRDGSASGTVIETIDVTSGSVTLSAAQATINPSSDLPSGKDIYVVVDEGCFVQSNTILGGSSSLLNTYNFSTGPITTSSFSPSDGATDQLVTTNIVITFSENITKGSGNITIRSGSASGSALQTIDVTSGAVSVSGTQATINPPSDLAYETDQYIVVDAGCFRNSDGDVASGNAIINTYNFTTEVDIPALGGAGLGGYLICCSGGTLWVVAPSSTEVSRDWYNRADAVTTANSNAACGDWFVPGCYQIYNPGYTCRTYWDSYSAGGGTNGFYWSNSQASDRCARLMNFSNGYDGYDNKPNSYRVRSFRCVSY